MLPKWRGLSGLRGPGAEREDWSCGQMTRPAGSPGFRCAGWKACATSILLILAAALPYLNSLEGPWLLDDVPLIARNPMVQDPARWGRLWTTDYWAVTGAPSGLYRPLTMSTYALTWAAAGQETFVYHLTNVFLHAAVTLLVWRVGMGGRTGAPAVLAAAVFALHPVHAEAVANVVGRAELLVALFFLLAVAARRRAAAAAEGGRAGRAALWSGAAGAAVLAMLLSKESGVPLLGYFVLEDLARHRAARREAATEGESRWTGQEGRRFWRAVAAGWCVLMVSAGLYAALRLNAVPRLPALARSVSPAEHFQLSASAAAMNARLLLALGGHRAVWSVPDLKEMPAAVTAAGVAVMGLLAGGLVWAVRRGSPAALGAGLMSLSLLPLLHPVPNVIWVWERGLYVPSIGLAWMIAGGLERLRARGAFPRWAVAALALFLVIGPGWRAARWSALYASPLRFWEHEYFSDPDSANAAISYSEVLLKAGRTAEAVEVREAAVRRHPESGFARSALVSAYASAGRTAEARRAITKAARAKLSFVSPQQRRHALNALALQADKLGLPQEAGELRKRAAQERD